LKSAQERITRRNPIARTYGVSVVGWAFREREVKDGKDSGRKRQGKETYEGERYDGFEACGHLCC
jgi:hypothetical protein